MNIHVNSDDLSREVCHSPFPLKNLQLGNPDKLGDIVLEFLWYGTDYIIYRTTRGVIVHFSDCPEREKQQRCAFTLISPELCELRFLTSQMHHRPRHSLLQVIYRPEDFSPEDSLFDHNIAQAIMLVLEDRQKEAKRIVNATLSMAVIRATNDNTIRYIIACARTALIVIVLLSAIIAAIILAKETDFLAYPIAALFGTLGAVFSILTRVQAFEMKPCQQSNMNFWMAASRVAIGLLGGFILYAYPVSAGYGLLEGF